MYTAGSCLASRSKNEKDARCKKAYIRNRRLGCGSPGSLEYNALAELQVVERKRRMDGDRSGAVDSRERGLTRRFCAQLTALPIPFFGPADLKSQDSYGPTKSIRS